MSIKHSKIKILIALAVSVSLCLLGSLTVFSKEAVLSDSCGESATYTLYDDNVLEISGSGVMKDYTPSDIPWGEYLSEITEITISDKITAIGINAFLGISGVSEVYVPESVTIIGAYSLGYITADDGGKIDGFKIVGKEGSAAEQYAEDNGFTFEADKDPDPSGVCGEGLSWTLSPAGVLTITGEGIMYDYNSATGAPWSAYAVEKDGYQIKSVVVSSGVTSIGSYAFAECRGITSISLPSTLKKIGSHAFESCSAITTLDLPESVETIGNEAFSACSALKAIGLKSGLKTIGDGAFMMTAVETVALPESVTTLGAKAFMSCEKLTSIAIPGITVLGDNAFSGCARLTSVTQGNALTKIGTSAFEGCVSLSGITFPSSLTTISDRAFYGCIALRSITLPDNLTYLGKYSFNGCDAIVTVSFGKKLQVISEGAFNGCASLESINIGVGLTTLEAKAFTNCNSLTSITLPQGFSSIAPYSFGFNFTVKADGTESYTKYRFVPEIIAYTPSVAEKYANDNDFGFVSLGVIPTDGGNITETAKWTINTATGVLMITGTGTLPDYLDFDETPWALYKRYIKSVIYGSGLENVGTSSFEGCSTIVNVSVADTVKIIGELAFAKTGVNRLNFVSGLVEIRDSAFDGCFDLISVNLPDTLTHIGQYAFRGPNTMKSMYVPANVQFIGSYAIGFTATNSVNTAFLMKGVKSSTAYSYATANGVPFREDGYIEVKDSSSGCIITMRGSERDKFVLSFKKEGSSLGDRYFLAQNEYALLYKISLTLDEEQVDIDGAATISFPVPANLNSLGVKIYLLDAGTGTFTPLQFEVKGNSFVMSCNSVGYFVISNTDLTALRRITVSYTGPDGVALEPDALYYATTGAEYEILPIENRELVANVDKLTGTVGAEDLTLSFTYSQKPVTTDPIIETDTDDKKSSGGSIKTVIIIVIIVLLIGLAACVITLYILNKKNKKDAREKSRLFRSKARVPSDKFASTIVVPDAPTMEIDIQSLFADDPEEDFEAVMAQKKKRSQKNK